MADPHALTSRFLELLGDFPEVVQRDAITFLPEIATEEDYEVGAGRLACRRRAGVGAGGWMRAPACLPGGGAVCDTAHLGFLQVTPLAWPRVTLYCPVLQAVISQLEVMMGQGSTYILPSIEALANLCLSPDQQARCRPPFNSSRRRSSSNSSRSQPVALGELLGEQHLACCQPANACVRLALLDPCGCRPVWWMLCWIASSLRMPRTCRRWRDSSCSTPPQAASSKRCCQDGEQPATRV